MKKPWAGLTRLRPGSVARAEDLLTACVRECAGYVAALDGETDRKRARLVASIGALVAEHTAHEPSADASFAALLEVGRRALDAGEVRLARRVADASVALRSRSKGAWRLRGQALEALGRDVDAAAAYERHLALAGGDGEDIALRLVVLNEKRAALAEAGRIEPGLGLEGRPPAVARAAMTGALRQRITERGAADPATRKLAEVYGTYSRLAERGRVSDPLLGGTEPIGVGQFRQQVAGRSVCVVGNGEEVAAGGHGAEIDGYDVVVRLDSFQLHAAGTGERTDVHAVSHRCGGPAWRREVRTRLVFGEATHQWQHAVRRRLVPGAQEFVGDRTLRRPVRDPALIGESGWAADAGTGFQIVRLLDFLDVSSRIDLIGLGLPGQLRAEEQQWVTARAKGADGLRIALR